MVQVYDVGEDQGYHFIAMEFVEGENLSVRLKREGKFELSDALAIVEQVAEVLRYARGESIIHRDIKPDNILLSGDGRAKLADLGIAKNIEAEGGVTMDGAALGTPHYMAPEQAQDARSVDHRADIYALGITLLQLLTGRVPFEGDSPYSIITKHREERLPTGSDLGTVLPAAAEALLRKMAAKDPAERYQDYDSLLADLEALRAGREIAHPVPKASGPPSRSRRARQRRPRRRAALFVAFGAVAVLVAAIFFATRPGRQSAGPAPTSAPAEPVVTTVETPVEPEDEASETPSERTGASEMLAYAESYANEHPKEYAKVIDRFREVERNCRGTLEAMKAKDAAESWQNRWEAAAEAELEKRQALAAEALEAWKFGEAEAVWKGFPDALRTASIKPRIEAERARVGEARKGIANALEEEAKPLLGKKPEELSAKEVKAVTELLEKAEDVPEGVSNEAAQAITALAEKLQAILDTHEAVAVSKAREAFDESWAKYESHI